MVIYHKAKELRLFVMLLFPSLYLIPVQSSTVSHFQEINANDLSFGKPKNQPTHTALYL